MDKVLYLLPVLACPVMMGLMLWMMRGKHADPASTDQPDPDTTEQIAALREEVRVLRSQQSGPAVDAEQSSR